MRPLGRILRNDHVCARRPSVRGRPDVRMYGRRSLRRFAVCVRASEQRRGRPELFLSGVLIRPSKSATTLYSFLVEVLKAQDSRELSFTSVPRSHDTQKYFSPPLFRLWSSNLPQNE